jgi:hypothetical protein
VLVVSLRSEVVPSEVRSAQLPRSSPILVVVRAASAGEYVVSAADRARAAEAAQRQSMGESVSAWELDAAARECLVVHCHELRSGRSWRQLVGGDAVRAAMDRWSAVESAQTAAQAARAAAKAAGGPATERPLAWAFLRRHASAGAKPLWFRPAPGFTGNHIVAATSDWVFDYHGYSRRIAFTDHMHRKARRWWRDWQAAEVTLPPDVLMSEAESRRHPGLWLREPRQFLHDALPRAEAFLDRFPSPPSCRP